MKNAMKRVMSILLVAMLLVSALPLAASATSIMDAAGSMPSVGFSMEPGPMPGPVESTPVPSETVASESGAALDANVGSKHVYFKFVLSGTGEVVGKDEVFSHNGTITVSDAIAAKLTNAEQYTFVSVKQGSEKLSESANYTLNPENCTEDAPFCIVVAKKASMTLQVYLDGSSWKSGTFYNKCTGLEMLNSIVPGWSNTYQQTYGKDNQMINLAASYDPADPAGQTLSVYLVLKSSASTTPTNPSETTKPTSATETTEYYNKFPYNVYLNIYKDTMVGAPAKTVNITKGIALDGTVTMDEVKALVMDYYNAKDSYGISFDGLYLAEGTWVTNYVTDTQKFDKFIDVDTFRQYRTVYINVMIDNAVAKSSSSGTADTSNPKTGDTIFAPIAVLGVSATALAAVMFFYNKKRLAQ